MKLIFFVWSLCLVFSATAQIASEKRSTVDTTHNNNEFRQEKFISLLVGYNYYRYSFAEIGLSVNKNLYGGHPGGWAYFISSEVRLDKRPVIGPKIGVWAGGGVGLMAVGLNLIDYTDFKTSSLRFRSEIGFGTGQFKIVYGYNFALTNRSFDAITTNNFSLVVLLGLKKVKSSSTCKSNN